MEQKNDRMIEVYINDENIKSDSETETLHANKLPPP